MEGGDGGVLGVGWELERVAMAMELLSRRRGAWAHSVTQVTLIRDAGCAVVRLGYANPSRMCCTRSP